MNATTKDRQAEAPAGQAQPQVRGGVVPYLSIDGAVKAAAFYARALDAKEVARHPIDEQGRTMHLHLHINGGSVMLSDPYPEHGHGLKPPQAFNLLLPVDDIDAWWTRAVDAGMEVTMPLQLMFWGDRYGALRDPFGVEWSFNSSRGAT